MSITIKDIAKELQLHHSTVSRALNGSALINQNTIALVKAKAMEMGYLHNGLASQIKTNRSKILAVVVPTLKHFFFSDVISMLSSLAHVEGYKLMIFQSDDDLLQEKECIQSALSARVAAIFISTTLQSSNVEYEKIVANTGIPLYFFDRVPDKYLQRAVLVDNFKGSYDATRYLVQKGRRRIAHLTGSIHVNIYKDRLEGYLIGLRDSGLNVDKNLIVLGGFEQEDGIRGVKELLKTKTIDAILAVGDKVAIGAIYQLKKMGIEVPGDVSVIGFDDDPIGMFFSPSLTTVSQNQYEIAHKLYNNFKNQDSLNEVSLIQPKLIIRESA